MSGFEIFGIISAIPPAALLLKKSVELVRDQFRAVVENDTNMTRVTRVYDNLSELLQDFSGELRTHAHLLNRASLTALTYDLRVVKQGIERASRELREMTTRDAGSSRLVRFLRSRQVKQDWQELESDAERLMHAVRHMSLTCTNIGAIVKHSPNRERMMQESDTTCQSLSTVLPYHNGNTYNPYIMDTLDLTTSQAQQRGFRDIDMNFRCTIRAPKNPSYVFVDFTNPDSPQNQLLCQIVRESSNSLPHIYSSRKIELIGKAGCGKTCMLLSLCTHQVIVSKFTGAGKGGIYYTNLGHNPNPDDVRLKLCDIVESSGGGHLRESLLSENISIFISRVIQRFNGKDTLFLFDEAYDETGFGASLIEQLSALSTTGASSAVVFSRRRPQNSVGEVVRVYPENDSGARDLLLRSAEFDEKEIHDVSTSEEIDSIVDLCQGNRRLLGRAGTCYKYLHEEGKREAGWQLLAEKLTSRLRDRENEDEVQDVLITEILNALQPGIRILLKGAPSVHRLYRALHVVKTREWIPTNELCKVWGLKHRECVVAAKVLLRGRLCQLSERVVGGTVTRGVEIHDCLWEYMCNEAVKHGEIALTA